MRLRGNDEKNLAVARFFIGSMQRLFQLKTVICLMHTSVQCTDYSGTDVTAVVRRLHSP